MGKLLEQRTIREIHRDADNVFMVIKYVNNLFQRIENDDKEALVELKIFISQMTMPEPHNRVIEYGDAIASTEMKKQLALQSSTSIFYEGIVRQTRLSSDTQWYTEPDQLLIETFLNADTLDADSKCIVSLHNGKRYVRFVLPPPEVIFMSTDYEKIKYCTLICLEELLHLSQMYPGIRSLHSLGIALASDESVFSGKPELLSKLLEADVTQVLLHLFPDMRDQKWKWYQDRLHAPQTDSHYPLSHDELIVSGYLFALFLGIEKEYYHQLCVQGNDVSDNTSQVVQEAYNDKVVRLQTARFLINELYSDSLLSGLTIPEQEKILETEFSRSGMTLQYLEHIVVQNNFLTGDLVLDYGKDENDWLLSLEENREMLNRIVWFLQRNKKKAQTVLGLDSVIDYQVLLQRIAFLRFR